MRRIQLFATTACALAAGAAAFAQQAPDLSAAQRRYERALAVCNSGKLPRPERDACVRDAGVAWDRARAGQLVDGKADDGTVTSPDGRATIVLPPDLSTPAPSR